MRKRIEINKPCFFFFIKKRKKEKGKLPGGAGVIIEFAS